MSQYSASRYDNASTASPDYDSPVEDSSKQNLVPGSRRTGVLKTVGDPSLGNRSELSSESNQADIPVVDFGTTYTPTLTPGHSRPATASGLPGPQSSFDQPHTAPTTPVTRSPLDERRSSGHLTPNEERRSSYGDRISPRLAHSRSASFAWAPGAVAGRQSPGGGLTAEEFVQHRATVARMPGGYVPYRSISASKIEVVPKKLQKRDPSGRSSSRSSVLVDHSSHLSAREQEHVARMTGGPLVNLGERSKTPDPSIGLIGAIGAREQEKKDIREGVAGHMVQEAIAQRQMAERMYGYQPHPGYAQYGSVMDARQNGQWMNPQSPAYFGAAAAQQYGQHPWSSQPTYQYQQPWQAQHMQQQQQQQRQQQQQYQQ